MLRTSLPVPRGRKEPTYYHGEAIRVLFGLPREFALDCPGILLFCHHLEKHLEELLIPQYNAIWKVLKAVGSPTIDHCWKWCFEVLEAFQSLNADDDSIAEACSKLIAKARNNHHDISDEEELCMQRAVFAVLCWTSATLRPLTSHESPTLPHSVEGSAHRPLLRAENTSRVYTIYDPNEVQRTLSYFFSSFQYRDENIEGATECQRGSIIHSVNFRSDDRLYESALNYSSLFTIGGVKIKWVDTLTAHLAFNRRTRTLSIFRFPSFCVANVLRHTDVKPLNSIITTLLGPSRHCLDLAEESAKELAEESAEIHREVLLSYRLLFGQSSKSRKLLDERLSQYSPPPSTQISGHGHPADQGLSGDASHTFLSAQSLDPFLKICALPASQNWPSSCSKPPLLPSNIFPSFALHPNGRIRDSDTYSACDDFPVFGQRLRLLQDYSMGQQPSTVKDLWRDRRNPLQWYTFWAVIWVGGFSILLSLLQLFVNVAQLYLATQNLST